MPRTPLAPRLPTPTLAPLAGRVQARAPVRWRCVALAVHLAFSAVVGSAMAQTAVPAATPPATPPAAVRLPALGESASDDFNLSQEKRIGEQIMREVRRDPAYIDDALLLDYVQSVWQPLVQVARQRGDIAADTDKLFPYEAFLVRDRSVNAFALPGGYVGVHLGLISLTATADELASVLAHELSHVTQRHIARSISAQSRSNSLGLAAMLLGLLVASRSANADVAQAAIAGGQAAMAQGQLNFSRDMEREADRSGLSLMTGAGFAPLGMAGMFDKLDQNSRLNDSGAFPYLRSHPLTVDRIGEARQRVEAASDAAAPTASARGSALLHLLMQMRARVMMDPAVQSLQRLQALDTRAPGGDDRDADRLVAHLSSALASTQLRDFVRAEASARAALAAWPRLTAEQATPAVRRAVYQSLTQVALGRGDAPMARRLLDELAADASRPTVLLRAQLALADGGPVAVRAGAELLQTWLADHRQDATAWYLLSQLADRQGLALRSVRAQAEAEAALGNLGGAIDRLRAGQQMVRKGGLPASEFIEVSVVDARLRDLLAQRRELMAEQQRGSGRARDPQREEPSPN